MKKSLCSINICNFHNRLEENEKSRRDIEDKKKETDKSQAKLDYKIAMEERKYVIARRKLEAIRLMDYLFERLKVSHTYTNCHTNRVCRCRCSVIEIILKFMCFRCSILIEKIKRLKKAKA